MVFKVPSKSFYDSKMPDKCKCEFWYWAEWKQDISGVFVNLFRKNAGDLAEVKQEMSHLFSTP